MNISPRGYQTSLNANATSTTLTWKIKLPYIKYIFNSHCSILLTLVLLYFCSACVFYYILFCNCIYLHSTLMYLCSYICTLYITYSTFSHLFLFFFFSRRYALVHVHTGNRIHNVPRYHVIREHRGDTLPSVHFMEPLLQLLKISRSLLRRIQFTVRIQLRRVVGVFVSCHFECSLAYERKQSRSATQQGIARLSRTSLITPDFLLFSLGLLTRRDNRNYDRRDCHLVDWFSLLSAGKRDSKRRSNAERRETTETDNVVNYG